MTTKYQRQWTEFEALKSIYEKEFEEIKFPWKVDHPPWFKVNLKGGIAVEFRMSSGYPDSIPEIKVSQAGKASEAQFEASREQLKDLQTRLVGEAQMLLGGEMCFELVELARGVIEGFLKRGKTSFHAEMLQTKEEHERRAIDQQIRQQKQRDEKLQQQRKLELGELERKIKDELLLKEQHQQQKISKSEASELIRFDPPIVVEGGGDGGVEVKEVVVLYELFNCYKWPFGKVLRVRSAGTSMEFDVKIVDSCMNSRRQLESMLRLLRQKPFGDSARHLIRCHGGTLTENDMFLLCEPVDWSSGDVTLLGRLLCHSGTLSCAVVVGLLGQVLAGLAELHGTGLTHGHLDADCILLCNANPSTLKLCDYLVLRSLQTPNMNGPGRKSDDISAVGRLALQMLCGRDCVVPHLAAELKGFLMSLKFPDAVLSFLRSCFEEDPRKRLGARELLESALFKEPITELNNNQTPQQSQQLILHPSTPSNTTTTNSSRYQTDFEELEFLGRGGFGSVVKVRNKIDDRFYAVKKIALDPRDSEYNKKILREVTTLSRLHHERIIRYYQAWIEYTSTNEDDEDDNVTSDHESKSLDSPHVTSTFNYNETVMLKENDFDDDFSISTRKSRLSEDFIEFHNDGESESCSTTTGATTGATDTSDFSDNILTDKFTSFNVTDTTDASSHQSQLLYIQMEYCPNQTLRDLLDERNSDDSGPHFLDPSEIWRLFRQIVEGLVHIHAQGMMHRDLKPSNIFLDSNGHVKIGDFGLAVTRTDNNAIIHNINVHNANNHNNTSNSQFDESMTQNIGTPFYVSPEQGDSRADSARYNQKVDMYSLGIILVELWVPFKTGMERIQQLQRCRLPAVILPPGFEEICPSAAVIAKRLLCHDPKGRFGSLELLRSDLLPPILEEELIEDALRSVVQPSAPHYSRLIDTIFRRQGELDVSVVRPKDFAFDVHSGNPTDLVYFDELCRIRREMERVFLRHGSSELNPPLLYLPLTSRSGENRQFVVIDEAGQLLELASNLTRPFARWIAQSMNLESRGGSLKRYAFDRVFKRISPVPGAQPFQPFHVAFDIVHGSDEVGLIETCEVVRVAFDALLSCGLLRADQLIFKFTHRSIRNLKKKITSIEGLAAIISEKDDHVLRLVEMLKKISVPGKVRIAFDSELNVEKDSLYTDDFAFLIVREGRGGSEEVLCCGGRYNQLVEEYKFPTARLEGKGPFAVGFCLYLERLLAVVSTFNAKTGSRGKRSNAVSTAANASQNHPYVLFVPGSSDAASFTPEEVWLIGELWRLGTWRPVQILKPGRVNDLSAGCIQVQVKSSGRAVRIKWKQQREVEEVALDMVCSRLRAILHESANEGAGTDESGLDERDGPVNSLVSGPSGDACDIGDSLVPNPPITSSPFEPNFHYILSAPKSERNPIIREKALKIVKPLLSAAKPEIVIHELPLDLLRRVIDHCGGSNPTNQQRMKLSGVTDSEEFRDQIGRLLQLLQARLQNKLVLLFNHKDAHIEIFFNRTQ